MKFRRFIEILGQNDFSLERQRGSHRVYRGKVGEKVRIVVVAFHRESDEIKPGTLGSMIR